MLLNRLELQGFKSFPDKISLDLGHQITAVVGPNGSGKSNITDSVRWLLGERDARNLRGGRGEDLIFAGTESRPRVGLAQATIYFNNSSNSFPLDFKEVSISRRISRDGTSQFFVNKAEVRLKDLVDILAQAKLGARGLIVINQGEDDIFIKASPTERRAMIEEILGLKEYQLKKLEAVRRLTTTTFNLEKVKALIEELRPYLRSLKRQVARYEGRETLANELRELENNFYGGRLERLQKELNELNGKEGKLKTSISKQELALKKVESELEKVSQSEPQAPKELKQLQAEREKLLFRRSALSRETGKLEAQLEFQKENRDLNAPKLQKTVEEIRGIVRPLLEEEEISKLKSGLKRIAKLVEDIFAPQQVHQDPSLEEAHRKHRAELDLLDKESGALTEKENKGRELLEGFNQSFREAYELVETERKELEKLRDEKNQTLLVKERADTRLADLKEELTQIGLSADSLGKAGGGLEGLAEDAALKRMFKLRSDLAGIGEVDEALVKEAAETEERYNFLTKEVADLEKAIADLKSLVQDLDQRIYGEFNAAIRTINEEFTKLIKIIFGGGKAKLITQTNNINGESGEKLTGNDISPPRVDSRVEAGLRPADSASVAEATSAKEAAGYGTAEAGIDIEVSLPKKRIKGLEVLSGGERSLVSIAALFALISVSPPPFLVLDEVDAALDEDNARRFGQILKDFSQKTQFVIITHNRATMEVADVLYGVTMSPDGTSKIVSLKLA